MKLSRRPTTINATYDPLLLDIKHIGKKALGYFIRMGRCRVNSWKTACGIGLSESK
ncbi:unnamed protein product [Haemonchus placei]|uniref:Transposase n=1 Tax=Haemonchus placei TaxID=6290 RepID=A0A0N4WXP0_HAEPC|nr:unnamed protein product [Haemonchus placei]